jgi:hypothetical protein
MEGKKRVPVGGHDDLDVTARIETVELVDELKHRPLHFVITAGSIVETRAADGVDFVEEDNAGLLGASHLEQLPHHPRSLTDVLLHELAADHTNESGVRSESVVWVLAISYGPLEFKIANRFAYLLATALASSVFPVPGGP